MSTNPRFREYHQMSAAEQRSFNRWLTANAVLAAIGAIALLAMALAASDWPRPNEAAASGRETTGVGAPAMHETVRLAPYELTVRYAPDQLPVQQVDAPF